MTGTSGSRAGSALRVVAAKNGFIEASRTRWQSRRTLLTSEEMTRCEPPAVCHQSLPVLSQSPSTPSELFRGFTDQQRRDPFVAHSVDDLDKEAGIVRRAPQPVAAPAYGYPRTGWQGAPRVIDAIELVVYTQPPLPATLRPCRIGKSGSPPARCRSGWRNGRLPRMRSLGGWSFVAEPPYTIRWR